MLFASLKELHILVFAGLAKMFIHDTRQIHPSSMTGRLCTWTEQRLLVQLEANHNMCNQLHLPWSRLLDYTAVGLPVK